MTRVARCRCGQLSATCEGEPMRVSVCHCDACKRRTGGVFAAQARFPAAQVELTGAYRSWERIGDSGRRAWFRWCPDCGATVAFVNEGWEETIAIQLGCFDADDMPLPHVSVWEPRKVAWVTIAGDVYRE